MLNSGKRFEQNFKASVPPNVFCYRLKDGASAWGGGTNTRFQCSNMCDYMLFDNIMILAELKSHKGKSLPLKEIRENQVKEMLGADRFDGVHPMLIANFEDTGECFALPINRLQKFIEAGERKSIPIEYFVENAIKIPAKKKKVNTEYDLRVLFGELDSAWSFDWRLP